MVRMSDLARGISPEKAAPTKEPEEKRPVAPGASATVPPALPRTRLAEGTRHEATAPPPKREPGPPAPDERPAPPPAAICSTRD